MNPLQEKLKQANEDYHEAVGEILADETVPIEGRAKFGAITDAVFNMMAQANTLIAQYYEESE